MLVMSDQEPQGYYCSGGGLHLEVSAIEKPKGDTDAPTEWVWRWRVFRVHAHNALNQKWKGARENLDLATAKEHARQDAARLAYTGLFSDWAAKDTNF